MSMSAILTATELWLRQENDWEINQCGIQPNSEPPPSAGQWYVSIDDGGIDQTARPEDHYLRELFRVEVGVWRRPDQLPKDRKRDLLKTTSIYAAEAQTLESLERAVIRKLHKSQGWRQLCNTNAGFPSAANGDQVIMPLVYLGRSKCETISFGSQNEHVFFGRRLRFRGADRTQSLECMQ